MTRTITVDDQVVNRRPLWAKPARVGALAASATLGIALINPTDTGQSICWSQRFLGIDCPLCGGTRCVNSLVRGDLWAAADHNLLATVALPIAVVGWAIWMIAALRDRPLTMPKLPTWVIGTLAVGVAAFTVARNLDGTAWLEWLGSSAY